MDRWIKPTPIDVIREVEQRIINNPDFNPS